MAVKVGVERTTQESAMYVEGRVSGDAAQVRVDIAVPQSVQFTLRLSEARELAWTLAEVIRLLDGEIRVHSPLPDNNMRDHY